MIGKDTQTYADERLPLVTAQAISQLATLVVPEQPVMDVLQAMVRVGECYEAAEGSNGLMLHELIRLAESVRQSATTNGAQAKALTLGAEGVKGVERWIEGARGTGTRNTSSKEE